MDVCNGSECMVRNADYETRNERTLVPRSIEDVDAFINTDTDVE